MLGKTEAYVFSNWLRMNPAAPPLRYGSGVAPLVWVQSSSAPVHQQMYILMEPCVDDLISSIDKEVAIEREVERRRCEAESLRQALDKELRTVTEVDEDRQRMLNDLWDLEENMSRTVAVPNAQVRESIHPNPAQEEKGPLYDHLFRNCTYSGPHSCCEHWHRKSSRGISHKRTNENPAVRCSK